MLIPPLSSLPSSLPPSMSSGDKPGPREDDGEKETRESEILSYCLSVKETVSVVLLGGLDTCQENSKVLS